MLRLFRIGTLSKGSQDWPESVGGKKARPTESHERSPLPVLSWGFSGEKYSIATPLSWTAAAGSISGKRRSEGCLFERRESRDRVIWLSVSVLPSIAPGELMGRQRRRSGKFFNVYSPAMPRAPEAINERRGEGSSPEVPSLEEIRSIVPQESLIPTNKLTLTFIITCIKIKSIIYNWHKPLHLEQQISHHLFQN